MINWKTNALIRTPLTIAYVMAMCTGASAQTFVFGKPGDPSSLEASNVVDGESKPVVSQMFDSLLAFKSGTTEVVPGLAKSWEVSEDGLKWTFHLRDGVKFHDGTPFDAAAVKFNFDRWSDPDNEYRSQSEGSQFAFWNIYMVVDPEAPLFKELKVINPMTVEMTLNYGYGPLLRTLAMDTFGISSPTAVMADPTGFGQQPVGTGPFKYANWVRDDRVEMDVNPDYWKGAPNVDKLIFRTIKDSTARFLQLKSHALTAMSSPNNDDVAIAKMDQGLQIVYSPATNIGFLGMNNSIAPFDNVNVRQAVAHAINRDALLAAFFPADSAELATQFIPPQMLGHDDTQTGYTYDPEKARQLLKEAGFEDGLTIDFWYMPVGRPYWPAPKDMAQSIASDLGKVGIKVNLLTEEWSGYLKDINSNKFQMWMLGWNSDNGDPDAFYKRWLRNHDPENAMRSWNNPAAQTALGDAALNTDEAKRTEIYNDVASTLIAEMPWVPVIHARTPVVLSKSVDDFVFNPTGYTFDITKMTVK